MTMDKSSIDEKMSFSEDDDFDKDIDYEAMLRKYGPEYLHRIGEKMIRIAKEDAYAAMDEAFE